MTLNQAIAETVGLDLVSGLGKAAWVTQVPQVVIIVSRGTNTKYFRRLTVTPLIVNVSISA